MIVNDVGRKRIQAMMLDIAVKSEGRPILLVNHPGNNGDYLIICGARKLLEEYNIAYKELNFISFLDEVWVLRFYRCLRLLKVWNSSTLVVLSGGGGYRLEKKGPLVEFTKIMLELVGSRKIFRGNNHHWYRANLYQKAFGNVLSLPHSIDYDNMSRHGRVSATTWYSRNYLDDSCRSAPDVALQLINEDQYLAPVVFGDINIIISLRQDEENAFRPKFLKSSSNNIVTIGDLGYTRHFRGISSYRDVFNDYDVVISDRLHTCVAGLACGKRVIVIEPWYKKIEPAFSYLCDDFKAARIRYLDNYHSLDECLKSF